MNRKQRRAGQQGRTSGRADQAPPDPVDLHSAGIEAFRAGRLEQAADLIAKAIAANASVPAFHYNLGIVLKARGRLQEAAASYRRAIALKPDHADAHNNLGTVLKALGERDLARASFERALEFKPGNADTHYNLGLLCSDDPDQAAHHFRQCLEQDPADSRGVRILLAQLGAGPVPDRTSQAQLQKIYDARSHFWDAERYFGPGLVAGALAQHAPDAGLDILDIGCGTGLVGARLRSQARPLVRRLDGVDLSPAMLEKARAKKLYDRLDQADLLAFLLDHKDSYDAILAAAALIHFGDLTPLFQATAAALRDKGLFVFTLFPNEDADFAVASNARLRQSGCFSHGAGYLERLAGANRFSVLMLETVLHEYDQDSSPVAGLLAVLRRE